LEVLFYFINQSCFGTEKYQTPEIVYFDETLKYFETKEDIWRFGISLFESAFGYIPFEDENVYQIYFNICQHSLTIPSECLNTFKLLNIDPFKGFHLKIIFIIVFGK
jgi:serine/threonine protein kinase